MTAARDGLDEPLAPQLQGERERAAAHAGDRGRDERPASVTWPRPPIATTGIAQHDEHDELPGGERDRVEALREVRADEDPQAEAERARERERVAGVEPERRACRAGTGRRPRTPLRSTTLSVGRRRVHRPSR